MRDQFINWDFHGELTNLIVRTSITARAPNDNWLDYPSSSNVLAYQADASL